VERRKLLIQISRDGVWRPRPSGTDGGEPTLPFAVLSAAAIGTRSTPLLEWLPILLFLGIALLLSVGFLVAPILVSRLTGTHKPSAEKLSEYECGFPAFDDSRGQVDVRFYLIAILFIIFDLEAAFLYPWAVTVFDLGWSAWIAMMIFLGMLGIGLVYEWRMGALDWD